MAKARIVKAVNYREQDLPELTKLEEILKREGVEYSAWVRDQTGKYNKAHAGGNPSFSLSKWVDNPGFIALPTLGEIPTDDYLSKLSEKDIELLARKLRQWVHRLDPLIKALDWRWRWTSRGNRTVE